MKHDEVEQSQREPGETDEPDEPGETGQHSGLVRMFVAIPLDEEVREQIAGLSGRLQTGFQFTSCRPAWCNPDSIHITLAFLGKRPLERVREIEKRLSVLTTEFTPLKIEIKKLGVFPDWHQPKVLWAGLRDRSHQIEGLHSRVEHCLEAIGYAPEEQPFRPHLTLARFKSLKGVSMARTLVQNQGQYKFGPFDAPEVVLYKSELNPAGPIHTPLCRILLRKSI